MNRLISYIKQTPNFDPTEVMEVLNSMSKGDALLFLMWNDPNGIYSNQHCESEGLPPLTESEAKLLCMKQLWENTTAA